jgi:hypothetical protein
MRCLEYLRLRQRNFDPLLIARPVVQSIKARTDFFETHTLLVDGRSPAMDTTHGKQQYICRLRERSG